MNKRYHKHDQYDFSLLVNENREKSIFCKYFTVRIILKGFQHLFQEGLLEKVLLEIKLYHKIPATSSVF